MLIDMISFTTICLIYLWFYYQHCMNEKYIGRELKVKSIILCKILYNVLPVSH